MPPSAATIEQVTRIASTPVLVWQHLLGVGDERHALEPLVEEVELAERQVEEPAEDRQRWPAPPAAPSSSTATRGAAELAVTVVAVTPPAAAAASSATAAPTASGTGAGLGAGPPSGADGLASSQRALPKKTSITWRVM